MRHVSAQLLGLLVDSYLSLVEVSKVCDRVERPVVTARAPMREMKRDMDTSYATAWNIENEIYIFGFQNISKKDNPGYRMNSLHWDFLFQGLSKYHYYLHLEHHGYYASSLANCLNDWAFTCRLKLRSAPALNQAFPSRSIFHSKLYPGSIITIQRTTAVRV